MIPSAEFLRVPLSIYDEILERKRAAASDPSPLWTPFAGPQRAAYDSPADELFYGGAAGGGKTDLMIGLALTRHRNSIIFRREFSQMRGKDGIIARSEAIIGNRGNLNSQLFVWRNLPGDRALEFGAMKDSGDWRKYQGRAHDLKAFDELPEFTKEQYQAAIGWLRTGHTGQRTRVVAAGNPPTTPEGQWVIDYWGPWLQRNHPRPAASGELRWYAMVDGNDVERPDAEPFEHVGKDGVETIRPRSRTFIPAKVEDNPVYMATGYDQVLNSLPEPLRSQMRFGNFQATHNDDRWQAIPTAHVLAAQARWTPHRPQMAKPNGQPGELIDWPLTAIGSDISRGGDDETTISRRYGRWYAEVERHAGKTVPDGQAAARLLFAAVDGDVAAPVQIDVGGPGASAYDQAREFGLNAIALNGSERSDARDRSGKLGFKNKRAEWVWKMREALDPQTGDDIALPPDTRLLADLCAMRYKVTPGGIQIEAKEDIKKRIGRSPDVGEAVIYASAEAGGVLIW